MKMQTENNLEKNMKRGEFLRSLGLGSSALMAFYCMGTLSSCGSDSDPDPNGGGDGGDGLTGTITGNVNFTVDLEHATYSPLKEAGIFKVIGDVIVVHTPAGPYVAVSKNCTHQGTPLTYRKAENDLYCAAHFSEFAPTGAVEKGPSSGETISALKVYSTTLSSDGKTLTVKA